MALIIQDVGTNPRGFVELPSCVTSLSAASAHATVPRGCWLLCLHSQLGKGRAVPRCCCRSCSWAVGGAGPWSPPKAAHPPGRGTARKSGDRRGPRRGQAVAGGEWGTRVHRLGRDGGMGTAAPCPEDPSPTRLQSDLPLEMKEREGDALESPLAIAPAQPHSQIAPVSVSPGDIPPPVLPPPTTGRAGSVPATHIPRDVPSGMPQNPGSLPVLASRLGFSSRYFWEG